MANAFTGLILGAVLSGIVAASLHARAEPSDALGALIGAALCICCIVAAALLAKPVSDGR